MLNNQNPKRHPVIKLDLAAGLMTIELESQKPFEKYKGSYSYEGLPIEFKILFENIGELHEYLTRNTQDGMKMQNGCLVVSASILGKTKQFQLPLAEAELSPQELLQKQIYELQLTISEQKSQLQTLKMGLMQKDEKEKEIYRLKDVVKAKESENKKALGRIRRMEDHAEEMEEQKGGKEELLKVSEDYIPVKKTPARVRRVKQVEQFGRKIVLKMDEKARYFPKFKVSNSNNEVEKLHGPTYQLFNLYPVPKEEKVFFDIRILQIKNYNIVVGLITDKNKEEQFSFKKMNCVCYNGYDGSICEQDKQKYVSLKPKENHKIRTVVDLPALRIEWFIVGGEMSKMPIGQASIPATMAKQSLFPYFELYWEGNKIKLNT